MSASSDSSTTTAAYAALGFGGGLLLSFSQIPQIVRVHKRKTTFDISYGYQAICATASTMFLVYYGYYGMWSTFIPCVMSLVFIFYVLGVKVYLEEYVSRSAAVSNQLDSRLGNALLPELHARSGEGSVSQ